LRLLFVRENGGILRWIAANIGGWQGFYLRFLSWRCIIRKQALRAYGNTDWSVIREALKSKVPMTKDK
jgi:hypothetical protein